MPFFQTLLNRHLPTALAWLSRRRLPKVEGSLRLAGLGGPAEIVRDRWGVPHISARDVYDLTFAQGYAQAQDRLWQMDFQRRLAAGRLAEVLGQPALAVDRWVRILGMRRAAEAGLPLLDAESRSRLEAFVAGVNACMRQGPLPLEFALLRYAPEPWTPADTLSWIKMMAWSLSFNWETELLRAQLIARLGPERAAELEPAVYRRCPSIVPQGAAGANLGESALRRAEQARPFSGPPPQAGVGTNNWAVAGARSASGKPLLANDLHVGMALPGLFYENHLACGALDVTGATMPGIPGVSVGHNGHVAWGFSTSFADVQDLYLERLRRAEDGRVQYEIRGDWLDAEVRQEPIRVRGGATATQEVIVTRHGPIINALAPDLAGEQPVALRWTALEPEATLRAVFEMNSAPTCAAFREALRHWAAPTLNVIYADAAGDIAFHLAGRVPLRAHGECLVPVEGWTGECEWQGYIPFDDLPQLRNPASGYVASANNRIAGDDYPHYISCEYALSDRARRIAALLDAGGPVDLARCRQMQCDRVSLIAQAVARHLGQLAVDDPLLTAVVEHMRAWDGRLTPESAEACVHEVFARRMIDLSLAGKLGDLAIRYAGQGPTPLLTELSIYGARSWEWLQETLAVPDSPWFDLGYGETRDDVMRLALRETVAFLQARLGPQMDDWAWGKLHTLTYAHPLAQGEALARCLNRGPYALGGDASTLWATTAFKVGSEAIVGPAYRFMVDLADPRSGLAQLPPGQSGRPGSPHYDDQIEAWNTGDYHPMLYAREDIEREAEARLRLWPRKQDVGTRIKARL